MLIIVDKNALRMVASASSYERIQLVADVFHRDVPVAFVDSEDGGSWSVFTGSEMSTLYSNMAGEAAPEYAECIVQLRDYARTWPDHPSSTETLKAALRDLEASEEPISEAERAASVQNMRREGHQAVIEMAEAANLTAPTGAAAAAHSTQAPSPKKERVVSAAPSRPGATKRVWEIAEQVSLAGGPLKEIRSKAKDLCVAEGINEGTFGVQFGKWKNSKGL